MVIWLQVLRWLYAVFLRVSNHSCLHLQGSAWALPCVLMRNILHRLGDSKVYLGLGLPERFYLRFNVKGRIKPTSIIQHCTVKNKAYECIIYQSAMIV